MQHLLNPPVVDGQLVWTFTKGKDCINLNSWIWDELQELEFNPKFWFATKEDCIKFLKNTDKEKIKQMLA